MGPAIYLARIFGTDIDTVVKFFIFILIFVFDPMAIALVIAYNITMVNRQQGSLDSGTTVNPTKKKKPKRLGLYKEGKTMMEKIVKETFKPDDEEVKKDDKVIEAELVEHDTKLPKVNRDIIDIDHSKERGAIHHSHLIKRPKKK